MNRRTIMNLILPCLLLALAAGCSSDGYNGGGTTTSVSTGFYYGHAWYDDPYYWSGQPGYVVVPPDRPVERPRPEQPIANPPGTRPVAPSQLPATAEPRPTPSTSDRSRMPSAQPRVSSSSARSSIPRGSRGGGGRRR